MTYLHWFALAAFLAIAEIFAPGAVLIWFAFGGMLVSGLLWLIPDAPWPLQVLVFLAASILSLVLWRRYSGTRGQELPGHGLNRRLDGFVGKTGILETAISHGQGRVKLGDTTWPVTGPDLPVGTAVRVEAANDGILTVTACENSNSP